MSSDSTVSKQLMEIVNLEVTLFNDPSGTGWARAHGQCWPVRSTAFKRWLQREFYRLYDKTPYSQAIQDVLDQSAGRAMFDGPTQSVHVRVANVDNNIVIDLGTDYGVSKLEITPDGWREGASTITNFWRPKGMEPLPKPSPGGNIERLRRFINVDSDPDFRLIVAWLLAALNPAIACPILNLQGEQGSAKSSTAKFLRSMVDPNGALIRSAPRDEREIIIQANNSRVLCLDNLSGIKKWLSDALCRICTGTGFSTRRLYTNDEEQIFKVKRPIILNGIDDIATRGDLLDRSIVLNLPAINSSNRKDERKLWAEFNQAQPEIFGCLIEAMAYGMRETAKIDKLPRMADFAEWITRCEGYFGWKEGTLLADYNENMGKAVETGLDSDILASAIRKILSENNHYQNTATALVQKIRSVSDTDERYLPTTRTLKSRLTRLAPALREIGITWNREHTENGNEYVLDRSSIKASEASVPSEISKTEATEANEAKKQELSKEEKFNSHFKTTDDLPF